MYITIQGIIRGTHLRIDGFDALLYLGMAQSNSLSLCAAFLFSLVGQLGVLEKQCCLPGIPFEISSRAMCIDLIDALTI